MSDLVKPQQSQQPKPQSQLVKPQSEQKQKLTPQTKEAPKIELSEELSEAAIAAADAPFAKAYQVYEERFSNNLKLFQGHIRDSQRKVNTLLKNAIYEAHGVNESDLYGDGKDE
jgi:hypothetical protein